MFCDVCGPQFDTGCAVDTVDVFRKFFCLILMQHITRKPKNMHSNTQPKVNHHFFFWLKKQKVERHDSDQNAYSSKTVCANGDVVETHTESYYDKDHLLCIPFFPAE
jgi:hypothetical protein